MGLGQKQTNFFHGKNKFFRGKRWFWLENQLFPKEKMVLGRNTNFLLEKNNHLFGVWPYGFPKNVFGVFPGKSLFPPTTIFPKTSWYFTPRPNCS